MEIEKWLKENYNVKRFNEVGSFIHYTGRQAIEIIAVSQEIPKIFEIKAAIESDGYHIFNYNWYEGIGEFHFDVTAVK
jgi:uncharacterized protein YneR